MADYGVILMVQLARQPAQVTTAATLAQSTRLPVPTVSKLLKQLSRAGLLESRRGTKGGYAISRPLTVVSVADIVSAVEGPIALTECMTAEGTVCEIEALCPTRSNWRQINDALVNALNNVSLAEMAQPILGTHPIDSTSAVAEATF